MRIVCLIIGFLAMPNVVLAQDELRPLSRAAVTPTIPAGQGMTHFQSGRGGQRDRLWNGMLIGAGVGVAVGMLIAPQGFCGSNDSECAAIVRVAIGLPAIAGGIGIGALVDHLNSDRDHRPAGAQVSVKW